MSMPAAIRHINQARLLGALLARGPMSRAEIARELDMMRSTAGSLVAALQAEGMITDAPAARPRRGDVGRPGAQVDLNASHSHFCGADIGVGYLRMVLLDLKAEVVATRLRQTGGRRMTPEEAADLIAGLLPELLAAAGATEATLRGLCIAVPGLTDYGGRVRRAPILGWSRVPFLDMVRDRLPRLATILTENDANAFAVAEMHRLRASGLRNALFLWLETGVGGAIMTEGRLLRGENGCAGELGHIRVGAAEAPGEDSAPAVAGTLAGSLESFVGREALLGRYRHLGGTAGDIAGYLADLEAGAAPARRALARWQAALARGLADLTSIFDPAKIVLGGPVAPLLNHCLAETRAAVEADLLPGLPIPDLEVSPTGADAAALGSALILHGTFLQIDETLVFGRDRPGA